MTWVCRRIIGAVNRMMVSYSTSNRFKKYMISAFMHHFPGQMSCLEFDEFITDYLEGSLSDEQRRMFEYHLAACPMCRAHLDEYRATIELARSTAEDVPSEAPQELINAILAARDRDM